MNWVCSFPLDSKCIFGTLFRALGCAEFSPIRNLLKPIAKRRLFLRKTVPCNVGGLHTKGGFTEPFPLLLASSRRECRLLIVEIPNFPEIARLSDFGLIDAEIVGAVMHNVKKTIFVPRTAYTWARRHQFMGSKDP
jgi:hypothetical protein